MDVILKTQNKAGATFHRGGTSRATEHDRWWLTKGAGLNIGTSFNGLGGSKDTNIAPLSADEIRQREADATQLLQRSKREHMGSN